MWLTLKWNNICQKFSLVDSPPLYLLINWFIIYYLGVLYQSRDIRESSMTSEEMKLGALEVLDVEAEWSGLGQIIPVSLPGYSELQKCWSRGESRLVTWSLSQVFMESLQGFETQGFKIAQRWRRKFTVARINVHNFCSVHNCVLNLQFGVCCDQSFIIRPNMTDCQQTLTDCGPIYK